MAGSSVRRKLLVPAEPPNTRAMASVKVERVVDLQLQVVVRLSSVVLAASKEALEVSNIAGAQVYFQKRTEVALNRRQKLFPLLTKPRQIAREAVRKNGHPKKQR